MEEKKLDKDINVRSKMEEKKLTDEVVVAKNAITDEEIAKAILQQIEYNAGIPYIDEWLKVKTIKFTDILNFIHRLQAENKELKSPKFASWKLKFFNLREEFDKELAEHEEFTKNAKAEIERLKDENIEERDIHFKNLCGYKDEIARLQKQVDELNKKQANKYALEAIYNNGYEQAVKDTAKEISKKVVDLNVIYGDDFRLFLDNFELWVKERYGVEVE